MKIGKLERPHYKEHVYYMQVSSSCDNNFNLNYFHKKNLGQTGKWTDARTKNILPLRYCKRSTKVKIMWLQSDLLLLKHQHSTKENTFTKTLSEFDFE